VVGKDLYGWMIYLRIDSFRLSYDRQYTRNILRSHRERFGLLAVDRTIIAFEGFGIRG